MALDPMNVLIKSEQIVFLLVSTADWFQKSQGLIIKLIHNIIDPFVAAYQCDIPYAANKLERQVINYQIKCTPEYLLIKLFN